MEHISRTCLYRSMMNKRTEISSMLIPGSVVGWEVQEDCQAIFSYYITDHDHGFEISIIEIIELRGSISGTDYRRLLDFNPMAIEYIKQNSLELMEI